MSRYLHRQAEGSPNRHYHVSYTTENKRHRDGYVVRSHGVEGNRQDEVRQREAKSGKTDGTTSHRHPRDTERGHTWRKREAIGITVTLRLGGRTRQSIGFEDVRSVSTFFDAMVSVKKLGYQVNGDVEYVLDMEVREGGGHEQWVESKGTGGKWSGMTSTVRSGVGSKLGKEVYRVRGEHGVAFATEWFEDMVWKVVTGQNGSVR